MRCGCGYCLHDELRSSPLIADCIHRMQELKNMKRNSNSWSEQDEEELLVMIEEERQGVAFVTVKHE